jgi:phosphoribosylformylglycinamidine synthase
LSLVIVNVYLKSEILDPQGRAISNALSKLGLMGNYEVRQGKQFQIKFEEKLTQDQFKRVEELAKNLLSNPVIEDYLIEVKNDS